VAKSGNRMLETCNSWKPGRGSVAEGTWNAWVLQEEGRTRGKQKILYDARMAPPEGLVDIVDDDGQSQPDLSDEAALRQALQFVYADCDWKRPHDRFGQPDLDADLDIDSIIERIYDPEARPSESKRKYLNWPTVSEDAWADPAWWRLMIDLDRHVADNETIALGFDGSKSDDATALIGCAISDGHTFPIGIWELGPDEEINVAAVDAAVAQAFRQYSPVAFFADVREWESFTKLAWPQTYGDRLQVMSVPTGKAPQQIAWDMRSHVRDFTLEAELVLAEIIAGEFTHNGDSVLGRHVANARIAPNQWGESISKESPDSALKIDGCVAMIIARLARRRFLAAPKTSKKQPSRVRGIGRR